MVEAGERCGVMMVTRLPVDLRAPCGTACDTLVYMRCDNFSPKPAGVQAGQPATPLPTRSNGCLGPGVQPQDLPVRPASSLCGRRWRQ